MPLTLTNEEVEQLRLDANRFRVLLRIFADVTGASPADVVRDVDRFGAGLVDRDDWKKFLGGRAAAEYRSGKGRPRTRLG